MPYSALAQHLQRSDLGKKVTLVQVDLQRWNEGILYWVLGDEGDEVHACAYDGENYLPFPFQLMGFEKTTQGTLPRPTLTVSNVSGIFTGLVMGNDDLIGATLTRIVTYERFLDGAEDADPDAHLPPDIFILNRKLKQRGPVLQWELCASSDVEGVALPGRQIVRDFCDHEYRHRDGEGGFDYTDVTCPFEDPTYFTADDQSTSAENDVCGKRLGSCRLRFGQFAELPFRGFPGVARLKQR